MEHHVLSAHTTTVFNTGRMYSYSPEGQIIEAKIISSKPCPIMPESNVVNTVAFNDTTRGVRGEIELDGEYVTSRQFLAAYDAGRYTAT